MEQHLSVRLPTLSEMIQYYGPYLGLVLSLVIVILILQSIWFKKILKAKNEEIKRLADREQKLNDRLLHMISEEIGYKKREKELIVILCYTISSP
jgi:ABC-type bacteriocin/lantibiotic exporter with double-glycine peptidase domain